MNPDTLSTAQLERGFRTLAHDWRNVLNGINLRVLAAMMAEEPAERASDLAEVNGLVADATKTLAAVTRKIVAPNLHPIAYPGNFFVEDLSAALNKRLGEAAAKRVVLASYVTGSSVLVDYEACLDAFFELLSNSLRYLPEQASVRLEMLESERDFSIVMVEEKLAPVSPEEWGAAPFSSTDKTRLGLGIYFARRVFEAHGGALTFEYSAAESILRTSVRLPLSRE